MGECMHMWAQGVHGKSLASQFFLRICNCGLKSSILKIIQNTKINAKKKQKNNTSTYYKYACLTYTSVYRNICIE